MEQKIPKSISSVYDMKDREMYLVREIQKRKRSEDEIESMKSELIEKFNWGKAKVRTL